MSAAEFEDIVDDMTIAAWECIPDEALVSMAMADRYYDVMVRINDALSAIMADVLPRGEEA